MRQRLVTGLALSLVLVTASCSDRRDAADAFLEDAWTVYLDRYVHPDGYVLDPRRDSGRVTSEGQGYALLRAVWERDEAAFRRIASWTEARLQRPDGLHSWLWTPEDGGRVVDANTATDGDMEIAWALLMAADVFGDDALRDRGAEIVRAVRAHAALALAPTVASTPTSIPGPTPDSEADTSAWFPAAGDWAVDERIANLSYFVPYAHPWFASVDPAGGWDRVTEVGYDLLERWLAAPDHALPPAFFHLTRDGAPEPLSPETALETVFSFDAVRLYWRIEMDCRLHERARACEDPLRVRSALELLADPTGIASSYDLDGTRRTDDQSTTFYAALLPAARRHAPEVATQVLEPRLDAASLSLLLAAPDRYYDHNWVWFGLALDRGLLVERTPAAPGR